MRRLQTDRRDHAHRARLRHRPSIDLDEAARADDRAAVVRDAASQVTRRAARFLTQAPHEPASAADWPRTDAASPCRARTVPGPTEAELQGLTTNRKWES
jgi:hypothetical protein